MSIHPRLVGLLSVCLAGTAGCERKLEPAATNADQQGEVVGPDTGSSGTTGPVDADEDGVLADRDCDDDDPTVGGPTAWFFDADGDGHAGETLGEEACLAPLHHYASPSDCDDTDATIHPDAPEVCNGRDDDCDAAVDLDDDSLDLSTTEPRYPDRDTDGYGDPSGEVQGCPTDPGTVGNGDDCDDTNDALNPETEWFADTDDDGYGDPESVRVQCEAPLGWTLDDHDCDDRNGEVHPGVLEICDGLDNDCDGDLDDLDAGLDLTTTTAYYPDLDADGFGDLAAVVQACDAPADHIPTGGDCDDLDDTIHPGAEDVCGDGVDNDCDTQVPVVCGGGVLDASALDAAWWGDAAGDETGQTIAFAGDVDGDGLGDVLVGAPDNTDGGVGAGKVYLLAGSVLATGGTLSTGASWTGEDTGDAMGEKVAGVGDVDGDGFDDLLFGADASDEGDANAGRAYLVFGGTTLGSTALFGSGDLTWDGVDRNDALGHGLGPAGDHDGDGLADLLLGAPDNDDGASNAGAVYIVYGDSSLAAESLHNQPVVYGASSGDALGHGFSLGHLDFDGDGADDLALGAYKADDTTSDVGAVAIFAGGSRRTGSTSADDATITVHGESYSGDDSYFGYAVADHPGDLNGDGHDDLVVGAYYWDQGAKNAGGLFVFYGDSDALGADLLATDADARLVGATAYDFCGKDVAVVPDLDGDGTDDLTLGCYGEDSAGYTAGAAYVVLGSGLSGVQWMPSDAVFEVQGSSAGDSLGHSVAGGDLDSDGYGDLLIGAPEAGPSSEGGVYIFFGRAGIGTGG